MWKEPVWRGGQCVRVTGPRHPTMSATPYTPVLRIGIGLELRDDGRQLMRAAHLLFRRDGLTEILWSDEQLVMPGGSNESLVAERLLKGLGKDIASALSRFGNEI
jgi:hypothetical protein